MGERRKIAEAKYNEADRCYRDGDYAGALVLLEELIAEYPDERNLLFAYARALYKLERYEESLVIVEGVIDDYGYEKAVQLRERIQRKLAPKESEFEPPPIPDEEPHSGDGASKRRFRIKPIRLLLLIAIIAGMAAGYVPYWLGIGVIAAYFVIKLALGALLMRLFAIPFKMKGKALAGANIEVHSVTTAPDPPHDPDDDEPPRPDLHYWYVDLTIVPAPATNGFRHWEPGELALAPMKMRIKSLDDLDNCFPICGLTIFEDDESREYDGEKYAGAVRLTLHVGLPESERLFKVVYYTETFGGIELPD